jgi:hypothetical protein
MLVRRECLCRTDTAGYPLRSLPHARNDILHEPDRRVVLDTFPITPIEFLNRRNLRHWIGNLARHAVLVRINEQRLDAIVSSCRPIATSA